MLLKWDGTGLNTCHISRTWAWMNLYNIYKVFAKGNLNNRAYFQRNNKNNFKLTKFWKKFQLWQLRNRSKNVPYLTCCSSNESKFYEFLSDYWLNTTTNQENHFKVEISKHFKLFCINFKTLTTLKLSFNFEVAPTQKLSYNVSFQNLPTIWDMGHICFTCKDFLRFSWKF